MNQGVPHVTFKRTAWRSIVTQAAGHAREAGGLLVGRHTQRNNFIIELDVALAHIESDQNHVRYDHDEVDKARAAAYAVYGPKLEPLGGWHTHPWAYMSMTSLLPQLSDDDVEEMTVGDLELVVVTFPNVERQRVDSKYSLVRVIGDVYCRGEIYLKVSEDEAVPCTMSLR